MGLNTTSEHTFWQLQDRNNINEKTGNPLLFGGLMFFEPIEMIWDTVPKKICNGPIKIGTIFAIRGNFCFYDVVNTFQHLYWILGFFSIKSKKLKAVCNGPIKICIIFPTMKSHGNFCFFRPYENFPTSSMLILPIFKRKQKARNNLQRTH